MGLKEVRERTAARKAAGLIPDYPSRGKVGAVPLRMAPCVHLGERLPGQPCGSPLLRCNLHGDAAARFAACKGADRCCASCPDYSAA